MRYTDDFFTFPDKETFDALAVQQGPDLVVDELGVIYNLDGEPVDGWHVNIRHANGYPEALEPYAIAKPSFPKRVFA